MTDIDPNAFERPVRRVSAYEQDLRRWIANNRDQRGLEVNAKADGEVEISMLDVIGEDWWTGGGITAKSVKARLDANPNAKVIRVLLNSPGGDVFEGLAIRSLLKRSGARVEVEVLGWAASAASVIAMAGDTIAMHEGSMMMVHKAWTIAIGDDSDMRATADFLGKINDSIVDIYERRTGRARDEVVEMVAAETWMTAHDAVEQKFADSVIVGEDKPAKGKTKARAAVAVESDDGVVWRQRSAPEADADLSLTDAERERVLAERRAAQAAADEQRRSTNPLLRALGKAPAPLGGMDPSRRNNTHV